MEMVEGKDMPKEVKMARNVKRGEETIGLLLRLTRSLYSTGKVVILDSGFCVLRGLIELRKVGVFASALIKKKVLAAVCSWRCNQREDERQEGG